MKSRYIIFLTLLFTLIAGQQCMKLTQSHYQINYNVINTTGSRIKVIFNGLWYGSPAFKDSVVFVQPDETRTLIACVNTRYDLHNPETGSQLAAITKLKIFIHDTIPSSSNFLLTVYWHFQPLRDNRAELDLPVTQDDFTKK
jgi:hypothetical protein